MGRALRAGRWPHTSASSQALPPRGQLRLVVVGRGEAGRCFALVFVRVSKQLCARVAALPGSVQERWVRYRAGTRAAVCAGASSPEPWLLHLFQQGFGANDTYVVEFIQRVKKRARDSV